jgi:hypothetical protein
VQRNLWLKAKKSIWQDDRTEEQKKIDDWLPVTSSRNAKWWYSAFHNVTAMVGAGVLSLPYAMSELGWYVILHWRITTSGSMFNSARQLISVSCMSAGAQASLCW